MPILHLILRKEFKDISPVVDYLQSHTDGLFVVEHDPDESEDPKRGQFTVKHCHCMLVDFKYDPEALRKFLNKNKLGGRGQYAILSKTQKERLDYDLDKLGVYMLKGCYEPKVSYLIPQTKWKEWQTMWVEQPAAQPTPKKKDSGLKEKKSKSHWDIMDEIWAIADKRTDIWIEDMRAFDERQPEAYGKVLNHFGRDWLWNTMIEHLNKNQIRTSRNELERFYVTLLRRDVNQVGLLKDAILKNIFR